MTDSVDLSPAHRAIVERILEELVRECEVRAFGSRATWTAKDYSDLDLAVVGKEPLPQETLARLREAFEESPLPMRVDVLDWHAISESFREVIERDYVVVQEQAKQPAPNELREVMLGEVADVSWGDTSTTKASYTDTGFPAYSASGHDGYLPYADFDKLGVVLSAIGANCGKTWLAKGQWSCIKNTIRFWSIDPTVDTEFLYWKTRDTRIWPKRGSAQPFISQGDARAVELDLPPLPEQRAIAHTLGTLDDKIELNRRMNQTLEEMARALFKSWFVDFDPVRAKMSGRWRPGQSLPGLPAHLYHLFPNRLVPSELGRIPKGWQVRPLGEMVTVVKGRSYRRHELAESDTALVTLRSFARGGGYRADGLKPFTGLYKLDQVVRAGEIVIACTDLTQDAYVIGHPAIVQSTDEFSTLVASLDALIVRPSQDAMSCSLLYLLAASDAFIAHTYAHSTGTTVLHLTKDAIPSFRFASPHIRLVKAFDTMASRALEKIRKSDRETSALVNLRELLLPSLVSGRIDLTDIARRV